MSYLVVLRVNVIAESQTFPLDGLWSSLALNLPPRTNSENTILKRWVMRKKAGELVGRLHC